jgi:general secretion pathway protein C
LRASTHLTYDAAVPMPVARPHRLALDIALLALVGWLAAVGVATGLRLAVDEVPSPAGEDDAPASAPAPPAPLADYAVIAARDIFNPSGHAAERSATLRLWGVGLQGDEARAVIEDTTTHRQELYRVGDRIGGARIAAIDWDHVTLERAGVEEQLALSAPATTPTEEAAPTENAAAPDDRIRRTSENAFIVDRRALAGALDGMSGVMTQLRAVAEVHDGRPAGFRLFQIQDDSLFAQLGLQNGDVVQRVNGSAIGEPAALLGFLQRLKTEPRVALDIVRADAPRTFVYDLR